MTSTQTLESQVIARGVPAHLGIIMDGNGRWAEARGLPRLEGHREGSASVREVTRACRRLGLKALTLYAFSSQNWSRPPEEVAGLMDLLREYLLKERAEIMENGIRLNAIGELDKLPSYVRDPLEALRADSRDNGGMVLTLALSYGGREELVAAAQALVARAQRGELTAAGVTEAVLEKATWSGDLPPLDLVVRSSGEQRLSNFMLWQSAYAEFVFTDVAWPDFRDQALLECLSSYQTRDRRFGKTGAQLKQGSP